MLQGLLWGVCACVPKAHPSGPGQETSGHNLLDDFSKEGDGKLSWLGAQNQLFRKTSL